MRWRSASGSFLLLQLAVWSFYGLATFLAFLPTLDGGGWVGLFLFKAVVRPLAGLLVSSALATGYRRLDRDSRNGATVAWAVVVGSLAGGFAWYLLAGLGIGWIRGGPIAFLVWSDVPREVLEYVFVMLAWSAAFFGIRAWQRALERQRSAVEAEARATEARLGVLTGRLNPHFLFNALSSVRGMVRRDPDGAERTLTGLAKFLRSVLVHPMRRSIPLREEMASIDSYLDVERARLGDRLDVSIAIEAGTEGAAVPPFLLHPLVENAVKYGDQGSNGRVRVEIRTRSEPGFLEVEVTNPGTLEEGTGREPRGTGIGLEIVRERLAHLYPGRHGFEIRAEDGWVSALLTIPRGESVEDT